MARLTDSRISGHLLLGMTCLLLLFQLIFVYRAVPDGQAFAHMRAMMQHMQQVVSQSQRMHEQLQQCVRGDALERHCQPQHFFTLSHYLEQDVAALKRVLANEKRFATITAIAAFDLLIINVHQYHKDRDMQAFLDDLAHDMPSIERSYRQMSARYHALQERARTDFTQACLFMSVMIMLTLLVQHWWRARADAPPIALDSQHRAMMQALQHWDTGAIRQYFTDTRFSADERKVFARMLNVIEQEEGLQQRIDLYASLYNILGYEVRDITNKIKGGMELLTQEMKEDDKLIARQMTVAADALEGLAENFNQLFSAGTIDHSHIVDIHTLIAEMAVSLASKVARQGRVMECYFDRSVPVTIYGNSVSLFWFFLLQLSNEITTHTDKHALLHVYTSASESIDTVQLRVELIFVDSLRYSLQSLTHQRWERTNDNYIASEHLMKHLLPDQQAFYIDRFTHDDLAHIRLSLEVTPQTYPTYDTPLKGKRVLVCGDSVTQIDTIATTLEDHGATLAYAKTPNDVIKIARGKQPCDAIVLTDTIVGVDLPSFCKTLHTMLSKMGKATRLFVSVFDPASASQILDQVDQVFYRPSEPGFFIETICKSLEEASVEKDTSDKRVLIVDDDPLQQMILGRMLTEQEVTYVTAATGEQALTALEEEQPMLIFMDCIMPGMGGIEATRQIRQREREQGRAPVTIIGASALSSEENRQQCMDAGMNLMIAKPFKRDDIHKVIKKYMAAYRPDEERRRA